MYRCEECGEIFEYPQMIKEDYGQELPHCPVCSSDYMVDVIKCKCCGENYTEYEFCPTCLDDMKCSYTEFIEEFAKYHKTTFKITEEVLEEALDELYE